ncbi:MAG: glycosyltransferase family 2 protein [Anaerocolumna sp.]
MNDEDTFGDNKIQGENTVSVDVIIPVYKPDNKFNHLMERLMKQSIKPDRILILHTVDEVSDRNQVCPLGKTEDTIAYALSLNSSACKIECVEIKKSEFDHGGTRNYGASLSQSEILIFMTQDAIPADVNLIKFLIQPFKDQGVAATYGRQLAMPGSGMIEKYTRQFNYPDKSDTKTLNDLPILGIKTYFCSNVCAAYRKSVYDKLGGFVTKTIFNEDMIIAAGIINKGYTIAYTAKARVYHSHVYTYTQQFKRNFDLAVSQQQYNHIFSSVKSENEGMKLVKRTMEYLLDKKQFYLIPELILQSGFKYLGYKTGRNYERLPKNLIKKLSMNPSFWN